MKAGSSELSDDSTQENSNNAGKRNRLSFVCQACRKNKTKCDKEKPRCGRCVKYNLKCVYDTDKQKPPRVPSKDAMIKRLEGEVDYWKRKAEDLQKPISGGREGSSYLSESKNHKRKRVDADGDNLEPSWTSETEDSFSNKRGSYVPCRDEMFVNFYKEFAQITMKDSMKRDVKPTSDFAQVYRDKILLIFVASIFSSASKNALIHSLPSEDTGPLQRSETQFKQNAFLLRDNMLQQCDNDSQRQKVAEFTERIMGETGAHMDAPSLFVDMLKSKFENKYIEDKCPRGGGYSKELLTLKDVLEASLPPLKVIKVYKSHFYQHIYPLTPFLDIEMFEKSMEEILSEPEPNSSKNVLVDFGTRDIRSKVCLMATLINILRISYICMHYTIGVTDAPVFDDETIEILKHSPIRGDLMSLSQKCISLVNLLSWTDENSIIALLYLWAVSVSTPERGDFYLGQPTDALISLISNLSVNIGLHRNPSDYNAMKDETICNTKLIDLRKRLWICVLTACRHEATVKARYHRKISSPLTERSTNIPTHSNEWYFDFGKDDPNDSYGKRLNSYTIKRYHLFQRLAELDGITMELDSVMSVSEVDNWFKRVKATLDEDFPLGSLIEDPRTMDLSTSNENYFTNLPAEFPLESTICFQTHILTRMTMLKINSCLLSHFEEKMNESSLDYSSYFVEYFIKTFQNLLELVKIYQSYLEGRYDSCISPYTRFSCDKICEVCLSTILFALLSMVLRITNGETLLRRKIEQNSILYAGHKYKSIEIRKLNEKLDLIISLRNGLEFMFQNFLSFTVKRLRFAFFSVFKLSIFFDYVLQIIKKKDVSNVLQRVLDLSFSAKVRNAVLMGLGVDINDKETILSSMNEGNKILVVETEQLDEMLSMMNALELYSKENGDTLNMNRMYHNALSTLEKIAPTASTAPSQGQDREFNGELDNSALVARPDQNPAGTEFLEAYNVNSFITNGSFDFFDYDFLLGHND